MLRQHSSRRVHDPLLVAVLLGLAAGMATASMLGPVVTGAMEYRTSPTTLNQLRGSDAAALVVIVPLAVLCAALVARGVAAGAAMATGIGVYAVYTYAQVAIGQEYLRLPGNVERFFPLLLTIFILGGVAALLGWARMPAPMPRASRAVERSAGWVLLLLALFLVLGLHLPTMLVAWQEPQSLTEYASAPTPFWMVKLMDLGIITPVAVATGFGLLTERAWARRVMYPLLTGYACLAISVASMAVVMLARDDPDASWFLAAGFAVATLALIALVAATYRPLLQLHLRLPATEGCRTRGSLGDGRDKRGVQGAWASGEGDR